MVIEHSQFITNQLLYQLSYTGLMCVADATNVDTSKRTNLSASTGKIELLTLNV